MTDIVERVARALWSDRFPDEMWDADQERDYLGHARAAIEAMREPSDEMVLANPSCGFDAGILDYEDVALGWKAMIDEALKAQP